ncbi:MAG: peptide chain release factor N(5)-glutamine methyltransferase [Candidatus Magasanikbacteria bacterium]|nr:peptide chain release factor N(5)-glutamine methyltransferase [Candidatus Magasanikbacteria bacterium]
MPTYEQLLQKYSTFNPLDLELLLAHALQKPRAFLLGHFDEKISLKQYLYFQYYLLQYVRGYSLAAITHHKEFFGLDFYVNKHVLIPRPETELMVEEVLAQIKNSSEEITLIDVGVGSGCVPISIGKNTDKKINIMAVDISCRAVGVAKKNAKKHGVNIKFFYGSLLSPLRQKIAHINSSIIITANLPYLTAKQFEEEPSIQREPKIALVADHNGLALYEKLLYQTKTVFPNKKLTLFLEIDPTQTELIKKTILLLYHDAQIEIKKDLSGLDRLVKIST